MQELSTGNTQEISALYVHIFKFSPQKSLKSTEICLGYMVRTVIGKNKETTLSFSQVKMKSKFCKDVWAASVNHTCLPDPEKRFSNPSSIWIYRSDKTIFSLIFLPKKAWHCRVRVAQRCRKHGKMRHAPKIFYFQRIQKEYRVFYQQQPGNFYYTEANSPSSDFWKIPSKIRIFVWREVTICLCMVEISRLLPVENSVFLLYSMSAFTGKKIMFKYRIQVILVAFHYVRDKKKV